MNMKDEIKNVELEIRHLKDELQMIATELKANPKSSIRQILISERNQVQEDLEEAEKHLIQLKEMPEDISNDDQKNDQDDTAHENIQDLENTIDEQTANYEDLH